MLLSSCTKKIHDQNKSLGGGPPKSIETYTCNVHLSHGMHVLLPLGCANWKCPPNLIKNFLLETKLELSLKWRLVSRLPFPSFSVTFKLPTNRDVLPSRGLTTCSFQFPLSMLASTSTPLLPSNTTTLNLAEDSTLSDTTLPVLASTNSTWVGKPSKFFNFVSAQNQGQRCGWSTKCCACNLQTFTIVQDDGDIENPYLHWSLKWLHLFFSICYRACNLAQQ